MENNNTLTKQYPVAQYIAIFIIIIAGIMYAQSLIAQLLMAFFISIICAQPIAWLKKKKVPQGLAITIVFILIIAVFIGFGELIGTSLSSFSEDAPKYEQNLREMGETIFQFAEDKGVKISNDEMTKLFDPSKVMGLTARLLGQLGSFMGNAFTIFFLVLFLLMELDSFPIKTTASGQGIKINYLFSLSPQGEWNLTQND